MQAFICQDSNMSKSNCYRKISLFMETVCVVFGEGLKCEGKKFVIYLLKCVT